MRPISIRICHIDDLMTIVDLHLKAFKDHINARLGRRYLRTFLSWFIKREDCIALVAVNKDGLPVGYIVGGYWGYQRRLNKDLFLRGVFSLLANPRALCHPKIFRALFSRLKILVGLTKHIETNQQQLKGRIISVVGVAIDLDWQRNGVGTLLLDAFEAQAIKMHFDILRLSVYQSNKPARFFYEKNGWVLLQNTKDLPVVAYAKEIA